MKTYLWCIERVKRIEDEERVERIAEMFFNSLDKEFLADNSTMDQEEYNQIVKKFRLAEGH
jgi:hypothetical protein